MSSPLHRASSLLSVLFLVAGLLGAAASHAEKPGAQTEPSPVELFDLWQEAAEHLGERDYAAALPALERLAAARPDSGAVRYRLAQALFRAGRIAEAMALAPQTLQEGWTYEPNTSFQIAQALAAQEGVPAEQVAALVERSLELRYGNRAALREPPFASLAERPGFAERYRRLAGLPPAEPTCRAEGWRWDLRHYLEEVRRLHVAPDGRAQSPEFAARVEDLAARVEELSDAEIAVELQEITTSLGDGHSVVRSGSPERFTLLRLPLGFHLFSDGLFILEAPKEHKELRRKKVLALGGRPTEGEEGVSSLLEALAPYASRDNRQGLLTRGIWMLQLTDFLKAMGYTDSRERVVLTVEEDDGTGREVVVDAVERPPRPTQTLPPGFEPGDEPPLYLLRRDESYWHAPLPDTRAIWVKVNSVQSSEDGPSIEAFARQVASDLRRSDSLDLVIDLRGNGGGNNFLIWPLVGLASAHRLGGEENEIYVITDRWTFSAAQNLTNFLDRAVDPVFVGEPSGSRPNFAGESTRVVLPWSGLTFSISSRYWQDSFPEDQRPYIEVALPVEVSSEAYFAGRDPVMEVLTEVLRRRPETGPSEAGEEPAGP